MKAKPRHCKPASPFRYFNSSPEVIWLVELIYVRFPLSLRNVEDLPFERVVDICHETVRLWLKRFGPLFAGEVRRKQVSHVRGFRHWRWHPDETDVKLNGEMVFLWRAVHHEGELLPALILRSATERLRIGRFREPAWPCRKSAKFRDSVKEYLYTSSRRVVKVCR